jgi:hypothetical protein
MDALCPLPRPNMVALISALCQSKARRLRGVRGKAFVALPFYLSDRFGYSGVEIGLLITPLLENSTDTAHDRLM